MTDETPDTGRQPASAGASGQQTESPDAVRGDPAFQTAMKQPAGSRAREAAMHRLTAAYHAESGEQVPDALAPARRDEGNMVERAAREALQPDAAPSHDGEVDEGEVNRLAHRLATHADGPPIFDDQETAEAVADVALRAGFTETDVRRVAAEVGQRMDADGARAALARWLDSEAEADRAVATAREVLKSMPEDVRAFIDTNMDTIGNSPSVILALARRKL